MNPAIRNLVESLETGFGAQAVLQMLQDGMSVYIGHLGTLGHALGNLDSPFAQRVTEMVRAKDPQAVWKLEEGESGLRIVIEGRIPRAVVDEIQAEFAKLFDPIPGLREKKPQISLKPTVMPPERN